MTDDPMIRFRLQEVAAYRELCQSVRRSGGHNVFFAMLMLYLAYQINQGQQRDWVSIAYAAIAVVELCVGLYKFLAPSAEGVLLDGLVLLLFVAVNLGMQFLPIPGARGFNVLSMFFGVWLLLAAINRFKSYSTLRQLFADRPSPELMDWVNGLIREIRNSDPHTDELALDLPTKPRMQAKLLGSTAFFVATKGDALWVAGPHEFEIRREKDDRGTGYRRARLRINDKSYPEFKLGDASWENYRKWLATNVASHHKELGP